MARPIDLLGAEWMGTTPSNILPAYIYGRICVNIQASASTRLSTEVDRMRFSTLPFIATALVAAGLASAAPLKVRADQTIILPLSGDPFGSPFEFEFADESRTADSISTLHITLQNATYSAVIADKLAFSTTNPDRASALLTVPHEFVPGLYDLVVEEVVGDDSIIYTGEVTDLELLSQSQA